MADNRTILLVEDNPDDEELTLRALKRSTIDKEVIVVRDGAQALDYLLARGTYESAPPEVPALVLLDLKLPKIGGLEVLRQLRESQRARFVPAIVLTSSKEEKDLVQSYTNGANSYIRKPVDFEQFCSAVHQLVRYWLALNECPQHTAR